MAIDEPELDRRLAAVQPTAAVDAALLRRLATDARAHARRSRRARSAFFAGGAALTLALGVVAGPAAADGVRAFLAQAQWFPEVGGETLPDSEWVDLGASDLREYIDHVYPDDLPLAPSQTREYLVDRAYTSLSENNALQQEVGVRRMIENLAFCGWTDEYLIAVRNADDNRANTAADILIEAADWPALVATDGGGITDRMRAAAEGARAGERGAGSELFASGDCGVFGFDPLGSHE